MNEDDSKKNDSKKDDKKSPSSDKIRRTKSFDIRNMFGVRSKNSNDVIHQSESFTSSTTSPINHNLNRNLSQPESNKFSLKKSILDHTQSMKKTTADFFGVNKEHVDADYKLWLEKRKRFYVKSGGKVKDKIPILQLASSDTNDSQHFNLYDGDPASQLPMMSDQTLFSNFSKSKPSVAKIAYKGLKNLHMSNKRLSNLVGDEQTANISMIPMNDVSAPQEIAHFKAFDFDDDTTGDHQQIESSGVVFDFSDKLQDTLAAAELPDDLQFNYTLPSTRTKTWTVVDRRQRIDSKIIESIYDNSDRRQYGMGIIGRLLNRKFRSNLTNEEKKLLNSIYDSRPYFTYWIMSVQLIIMILALLTYGFGPFGLQKVKISQPVLVNSLSIQEVSYFEPNNIWFGPRASDLIHLGAKYTPCMRKDKLIFDEIIKEREDERDTACCIRTDKSGCIQTKKDRCSPLLSTWKKWSESDNITYLNDDYLHVPRTSGSVCGQDPRYCLDPKSWFPNIWPDDITKWPICRQLKKSKSGNNQDSHMSCNLIGKPCCIGIHGECKITTKDYCDFVKGFFHEEATLCSQVSCMSDVCGMIQIKRDDNLSQFYRPFTSLFLHAGFLHILISFIFQYYIMRDFEKLIGSTRICIIYLLSGIGGNLASAIFVPYRAEVGPGGSQFGILAGLVAEQIHSWNLIENPGYQLLKLFGIALVLFIYGLFPWIDNYAHIFGFLIGFLLSLALLPFLTFTEKMKRRLKIMIIWTCFVLVFSIFIILLLFLYKFPIYDCKYCSYLNCLPLTPDWCSDHQISVTRKDIL